MALDDRKMSKLAQAIAHEEGYYVPGSLPNRDNNPGDLRHSPHSFHTADAPDAIGQIDSVADGWADLERQLEIYAQRGLTLGQAIYEWAPPTENDSAAYLAYVIRYLGPPANTDMLVSDALKLGVTNVNA
jgi:hypothetical protein